MTLGRTSTAAIKIKTDSPKGLRAVGCACCGGGGCKLFRFTILGLTFDSQHSGMSEGIPYDSTDDRGLRCDGTGEAAAGGVVTYISGTDFYCDGGSTYSTTLRTGGSIALSFNYFLETNTIENLFLTYRKSLDPAGTRECVQSFFCERGKDSATTEEYEGSGISFPAQNGTYSIPVTYTYSFTPCIYDYSNSQEGYTDTSETTVSIIVEVL